MDDGVLFLSLYVLSVSVLYCTIVISVSSVHNYYIVHCDATSTWQDQTTEVTAVRCEWEGLPVVEDLVWYPSTK